jgi:uncharacterized protein (DUF433 family)
MSNIGDYITIDSQILSGIPVFKGTRVPVESLFSHLANNVSLSEFMDDFPSVSKEQAIAVIEMGSEFTCSWE